MFRSYMGSGGYARSKGKGYAKFWRRGYAGVREGNAYPLYNEFSDQFFLKRSEIFQKFSGGSYRDHRHRPLAQEMIF